MCSSVHSCSASPIGLGCQPLRIPCCRYCPAAPKGQFLYREINRARDSYYSIVVFLGEFSAETWREGSLYIESESRGGLLCLAV